jgi:hypothetical protein
MRTNEVSMQDGSNDFDGGNFGARGGDLAAAGFVKPFTVSSSLNHRRQAFAPQGFTGGSTFGPSPFGSSRTAQDDDMGDARISHSPLLGTANSPVPEASMLSPTPYNASDDDNDKVGTSKESELARLKAKLAAKKKLQEAKLRKSVSENSPPPSPKQLRTSRQVRVHFPREATVLSQLPLSIEVAAPNWLHLVPLRHGMPCVLLPR